MKAPPKETKMSHLNDFNCPIWTEATGFRSLILKPNKLVILSDQSDHMLTIRLVQYDSYQIAHDVRLQSGMK